MPATSHTSPVGGKPYSTARWRGGPSAPRSGQPSQSTGGGSPETSTVPSGMSRCWLIVVGLGHRATMWSSLSVPTRRLRERVEHGLPCSRVRPKGRKDQGFYLLPLNIYLPVYGSGSVKLLCHLANELQVGAGLPDRRQRRAVLVGVLDGLEDR